MPSENTKSLPYRPCAGVVLINRDGFVFGGQRLDNTNGAWQMPQGGLDFGELPEEAALRELTEETGVPREKVTVLGQTTNWIKYDLPKELLGKLWKGKFCGQEQMWFAMQFLGKDSDINIATEHPEFSQWKWMTPADLIENVVPFKRHVYESVFSDLGRLIKPI